MKLVRALSLALAIVAMGTPSWAAQHDQHKAHHPAGSASAAAAKPMPGKTTPEMARVANQARQDDGRQDTRRKQCADGRAHDGDDGRSPPAVACQAVSGMP